MFFSSVLITGLSLEWQQVYLGFLYSSEYSSGFYHCCGLYCLGYSSHFQFIPGRNIRDQMINMLNCDIVVSSNSSRAFELKPLEKAWTLLSTPPAMD